MSKETPSFSVYCIFGFCDSKSQTMLPAKGRKCWRVKESVDLRLFERRMKGLIVNLGGCRRRCILLDGTLAKICRKI